MDVQSTVVSTNPVSTPSAPVASGEVGARTQVSDSKEFSKLVHRLQEAHAPGASVTASSKEALPLTALDKLGAAIGGNSLPAEKGGQEADTNVLAQVLAQSSQTMLAIKHAGEDKAGKTASEGSHKKEKDKRLAEGQGSNPLAQANPVMSAVSKTQTIEKAGVQAVDTTGKAAQEVKSTDSVGTSSASPRSTDGVFQDAAKDASKNTVSDAATVKTGVANFQDASQLASIVPTTTSHTPTGRVESATPNAAPRIEATINTPVGEKGWSHALADNLVFLAKQEVQTARLHVTPPDMGPIAVEIRYNDKSSVDVTLLAGHSTTRESMQQSLSTLKDAFSQQGMQIRTDIGGGQQGGQQAPTREEWLSATTSPGVVRVASSDSSLHQQAASLNSESLLDYYV